MQDTANRLRVFEQAYDEYVHKIEQFDHNAARLLQNMPEIGDAIADIGAKVGNAIASWFEPSPAF